MQKQDSDEYKSIGSPEGPQSTQMECRMSFLQETELFEIYTKNNQRKRELEILINNLKPKMIEKKLAQELQHDPRATTGIQVIIDSDQEDDFDDIQLDVKQIKEDYNKKKQVISNLQIENKSGILQKAFVRKFSEKTIYMNEHLKKALQKKFKIKKYFTLTKISKFGVLTQTDANKCLIKFISVGIPKTILDSIQIDYNVTFVSSNNVNRLIVVMENEANLYDIEAKEFILKTHKHESPIVFAAFPQIQIPSILTVSKQGVVRLFDINNKTFYWMCMTDSEASAIYCRGDKVYFSLGYELHSVSLKTKQMVFIGKTKELIQQIDQRYVKAGKTYFNVSSSGEYQTAQGLDYININKCFKYYPGEYALVNDKRIDITPENPKIIGQFTIGQQKVLIIGGSDGELQQIQIPK